MSEGEYEYECMRCELLGLTPPSKEEFRPKPADDRSQDDVEEENLQADADQNMDLKEEHLKTASGGLDELNNILSLTQKKLNKFKVVCGSFTSLLRMKVGGGSDGAGSEGSSRGSIGSETEGQREPQDHGDALSGVSGNQTQHDVDVSTKVDSQVDKLDSLLMKAEKAHISMTSQNKQMKSFLN